MDKNKFYITTPIYYANGSPHLGHAYTTIAADVLARFNKRQGKNVFLSSGMDEHGLKIQQAAEKAGKTSQEFVDGICKEFQDLYLKLNIEYDGFIRTTSEKHKKAVQNVLLNLYNKGAIYKGSYKGLYCVGCEQFLSESQLVDGKCPDHNKEPEILEEKSYLLKMGEKQKELINKIENDKFKISPHKRKNEILTFLTAQKLQDVAISRNKKSVSWGIELPFDNNHVTYVWVDAFLNYLTVLEWDGSAENIPEFFPPDIQLVGKDILRVHATIWPAILLHMGIKLPREIFAHGMIISGGKKMSKTLGNVISPYELIDKFGVDATRYLLMSAGKFGGDPDITMERIVDKYSSDLVKGVGSVISRVAAPAEKRNKEIKEIKEIDISEKIYKESMKYLCIAGRVGEYQGAKISSSINYICKHYKIRMSKLEICDAIDCVIAIRVLINGIIDYSRSEQSITGVDNIIPALVESIRILSHMIYPFMPDTSEKIFEKLGLDAKNELAKNFDEAVKWGSVEFKNVKKGEGLFPRII